MPRTRPLGAQISHMLKDRGVDVIFGIPGVHNQELYRGIEEAGITHVLARHEQGAGFMADGYARASGKPGVAYVITGPGLCNIMTPMGQAYSDSVPMLVISSCLDETAATRGQLHQMKDQRGAAATVCDWSEEARTAEAAYALIDRAFVEFKASRARPKHVTVPIQLLEAQAPAHAGTLPDFASARDETPDLSAAVAALGAAKRPMIIAGGGALDAGRQLMDLAELLQAASFTTYAGRGLFYPGLSPLHYGSYLARSGSADVIAKADVVLAVGTELAEVDIWRDTLGITGTLIRVDIDSEVLASAPRADIAIRGRAGAILEGLCHQLQPVKESGWPKQDVTDARKRFRAEVDTEYPGIPAICDALRACLPEAAMIYSDMTQFAYAAKEVWDMDRPGHWHHPYGFGTLGYALPAAIGGAVARKGLPTMAIIGDYGFHYTMAELGVAVELGLPIPIILWDNAKLGAIEASMIGAQIAPNAVIARNPDFCKLAEAFGAHAAAPKSLTEMQMVVKAAFDAVGPTLIYLTPDITADVSSG